MKYWKSTYFAVAESQKMHCSHNLILKTFLSANLFKIKSNTELIQEIFIRYLSWALKSKLPSNIFTLFFEYAFFYISIQFGGGGGFLKYLLFKFIKKY